MAKLGSLDQVQTSSSHPGLVRVKIEPTGLPASDAGKAADEPSIRTSLAF
jgi:hypothetical protein